MRHALEDVAGRGLGQGLVLRRQLRHDLLEVAAHREIPQRQPTRAYTASGQKSAEARPA